MELVELGYWAGPDAGDASLPSVDSFVDPTWDAEERDLVAGYLGAGQVAAMCMGYSSCRVCGIDNGNLDITDGVYVWPSGLAHYVEDHAVRLPDRFVQHAIERIERFETATRNREWWHEVAP